MKNKTYDFLKDFALIFPLFITFIVTIMKVWDIPYTSQIELTLLAIETLVAGIVKTASVIYNNKLKKEEN